MASRPNSSRRRTSCIVHTLLEKHDGKPIDDSEHSASDEMLAAQERVDKDPHGHAEQVHYSRLLTKSQISEMALGIRDLSKKLSSIRLKLNVRNIFVLGKAHDETLIKYQREVVEWTLARESKYNVYVEDKLESNKIFDANGLLEKDPSYQGRLKYWNNELCSKKPQTFDIVLAVSRSFPGALSSQLIL
jgi:NAD+ kinase